MDVLEFMKRRSDLQSLMMSSGAVFAGTGAAALRGNMEILSASVCLLFALVTQLGCNLYHYYVVMNGAQGVDSSRRSSLSKVSDNPLALRVLKEGSTACLILSLMLGLTIMTMSADFWWALLLGAVIYGLVFIMISGPRLYRRPVGLVITFLIFGPIGVMGTSFLQFQHEAAGNLWSFFDSAPCLFLGPAMGFLACSHHLVLSYANNKIEAQPGRTGSVRAFGYRGCEVIVGINGLLALVLMVAMVYFLQLSAPLLALAPSFLGFALNTYICISLHRAGVGELRHLLTLTRVNYLLTGLLSLVVWWAIGPPDDSLKVLLPIGMLD